MADGGGTQQNAGAVTDADLRAGCNTNLITIQCKNGKDTHEVSISPDVTIEDLKAKLQDLTNVLPRGQKLIFKGKVLDGKTRLQDAGLSNGSKIMMIASVGVHQGSGSSTVRRVNPSDVSLARRISDSDEYQRKLESLDPQRRARWTPVPVNRVDKNRALFSSNAWAATGIISLRDRNHEVIPKEVWETGSSGRVLDLAGNRLKMVPDDISRLVNLQKLRLSLNNLREDQLNWHALGNLKHLVSLVLDSNQLTSIPSEVGLLQELKHLSVSKNMVKHIAEEIGNLSKLEKVDFSSNSLNEIPSSLGQCSNLIQIDFSSNLLKEVPPSLGQITSLKSLCLISNGIKTFPSEILKGCLELQTIALHGNQITLENLREVEGWAEFDERRKAKHSKQLDFSLLDSSSRGFDEGADSQQWHHW